MPASNDASQSAKDMNSSSSGASPSSPLLVTRPYPYFDNNTKIWMKNYRTEIAASSASLLSTLSAYPLDSMKTRMQAYKFPSFLQCVKHTYRTEGAHGFWRGALAPLASITLVRTVSFSIYQKAKYTYDEWIHAATGVSPLVHANTPDAMPTIGTVACFGAAGATSGSLITAISCPFELTKLNAQIAVLMERGVGHMNSMDADAGRSPARPGHNNSMGTFGTAKMIMQHRGLMGLYSGFHLHLLRDTIGTAIYFMTYESSKQVLANGRGNSPTSPLAVVMAGGLCGLVSWACIYPIDSAKSIYQRNVLARSSGQAQTSDPSPREGSSAPPTKAERDSAPPAKRPKIQFFNRRFYRGIGVSMSRSCLINAIFFSAFEVVKKWINRLEVEEDE